jgi:hypothetical protein
VNAQEYQLGRVLSVLYVGFSVWGVGNGSSRLRDAPCRVALEDWEHGSLVNAAQLPRSIIDNAWRRHVVRQAGKGP